MLFLTVAAAVIVRKNVHMSMISRSLISAIVSSAPAMMGESRYLALPARETSPLAFEYSSGVSRSVIVALNDGSRRAENTELIPTPIHICRSEAPPLCIQMSMKTIPMAESPSPAIMSSLRSYLSASTPAGTLSRSPGRKAISVTSAISAALPVILNTYTPRPKEERPPPIEDMNSPAHRRRNFLRSLFFIVAFLLYLKEPADMLFLKEHILVLVYYDRRQR